MTFELAGLAGILAFAAAWELAGFGVPPAARRASRELGGRLLGPAAEGGWAARFEVASRLERAGLSERVSVRSFVLAKLGGAGAGAVLALLVAPVAPGRLAVVLACALVAAGFMAPEALAERAASRRRARLVAALPDALDLVAVGAAAGRSPAALFSEIATGTAGPLAAELALTVAEVECGISQTDALAALRRRTGAIELGSLSAALERSRRYGSPLADQLHAQAASLRRDERRRIEERAARAAPKIQLVVAMILVPSALLTIAAALIAHSGELLGSLA